jgi:hypothetical protein
LYARPVESVDVNTVANVILVGALAAVWLTAGVLADFLATARDARELRRRAARLALVIGGGAAVFVAVLVIGGVLPGGSASPAAALPAAVPVGVVLTVTWRRLTRVRQGAGTFAAAPRTPLPPGLRAAAAHPLILVPLQATGLAALIGLPIAGGLVTVPGTDATGIAVTLGGVAVAAIAVRTAVRHSRLLQEQTGRRG